MVVAGVNLPSARYVLATLLFTTSVGVAEELYFRGIILRTLRTKFRDLPAIAISAVIFGAAHASSAFVEADIILVLLTILNAVLFGWVAAEAALLSRTIVPLMIFHCLFDFLTYQMQATGEALLAVYAARGALMVSVAVYLLKKLRRQPEATRPFEADRDGPVDGPLAKLGQSP